jgi:RNA polymerase sigma-70 factor (ECF subfamily)
MSRSPGLVRPRSGAVVERGANREVERFEMSDQDRDRSCIDRLQAGDVKAFEELYDRHNPMLWSMVLRIVGRAPEAEEVLQDAWLQVWRSAGTYQPSRGTVVGWLLTLARSRAIDRLRSLMSRQRAEASERIEPPTATSEPPIQVAQLQVQQAMAEALAALPQQHRQVLQLAYFTGLSQSEIAARLGAPLGTVKSWTRQALSRLRDLVPQEKHP